MFDNFIQGDRNPEGIKHYESQKQKVNFKKFK